MEVGIRRDEDEVRTRVVDHLGSFEQCRLTLIVLLFPD